MKLRTIHVHPQRKLTTLNELLQRSLNLLIPMIVRIHMKTRIRLKKIKLAIFSEITRLNETIA
jgi:hypothetical protein